ncbi:MAG TPA: penicillin-binding protein 1C [Burkholderiaceae bacterium]|nr:penicillin-binding protein 1C [Burkholderiaceae bacterium]
MSIARADALVLRGLVLTLAVAIGALTSPPAQATQTIPSFAEVRAAHHPSDITLLARDGTPIQTLRVDDTVRRLAWVPLEEMSPALLQAIVLSEDRRFYAHSGVDWAAVAQSAWANLWNERTRGASTLTMQLAGLIDDDLARPRGGRSVAQKFGQALTATQLEAHWTKSEILEAYLNSVPFRGELVGIGALAQTLFGKHASGLDAQEAALAAALVRGPNARPEVVAQRACGVLRLQQAGAASGRVGTGSSASAPSRVDPCRGIRALAATAFVRRGGMVLGEQLAPHFARRMIDAEADTSSVQRSTLDASLQRLAVATLREQLSRLAGRNVEDGAIVVLDNRSGEVLAWVGSSGDLSDARQVDGVLARRQPGSTLKPFVYELAFEQRLITPASLIDDAPLQIATPAGLYLPRDYDGQFKGWVSARTALGASLNVPAVRVGAMLGPDALAARLNAFGLALKKSGGYYGSALALGSAEVTLLALTNAYRTLANGGLFTPVRLRPSGETSAAPHRVAQADAVYLVTDILADNNARVRTFGLDSLLATRGFAAVKTGTSSDMRDNWCVGFTDRYTVGVWVGNASGAAMHDVSGISGATPIWQTLVRYLHAGRPSQPPDAPAGVLRLRVTFEAGREPARDEVFLAGTEQVRQRASAQVVRARRFGIASPRDGSIFAIDPDMPPTAQRIRFEGELGVWVLDGKRLGTARRWSWAPWPGRHELTLLGRDGQVLQTVRFEVRGAGVKNADQTRH